MGARRQLACAADPPGAIGRVAERDGSTPIYKWDNQMSRSLMCLCHVRSVTRVGSEWVPEGYLLRGEHRAPPRVSVAVLEPSSCVARPPAAGSMWV